MISLESSLKYPGSFENFQTSKLITLQILDTQNSSETKKNLKISEFWDSSETWLSAKKKTLKNQFNLLSQCSKKKLRKIQKMKRKKDWKRN